MRAVRHVVDRLIDVTRTMRAGKDARRSRG
jgi:hypothetical protein